MYPVALKEKGLVATVREYVFEWEGRTDIQADVNIKGERRLSLNKEQAIFRVIQEALSNISRHSQANHVGVNLTYSENQVEVIISDDGCGFDRNLRQNGMGLLSIQERIQSIGGRVDITTSPNCGTRLYVNVPIE
jgi:signal transduction histidine kinase